MLTCTVNVCRISSATVVVQKTFEWTCSCFCPAAGYEGTPWADGFDRKIRASGEYLFFVLFVEN